MSQPIVETTKILEAAGAEAKKSGRMLVQHLSPGWGSSGYYSTELLEQAVEDKVIPAGTHMYADHPTETEKAERPVRSIKDLMAVTVEDGRLATKGDVTTWGADLGAVVSEVQVVPAWRELVENVKDSIGTSIRGGGTGEIGEAEGRTGMILESITAPVQSVDFVTHAGRGGKVLQIFESAAANRKALEHGISEATVNDTREALQTVLKDAYGVERTGQIAATYVWVRDFDDSLVWFEVDGPGSDSGLYQQSYTQADNGAVALSGTRIEVRVRTTYVPATRSDSTTTTEESKEDTMGNISIEESEHKRLVEEAGRVATLENERDTEKAGRIKAEEALAERDRRDAAVKVISEAKVADEPVQFTALEQAGLLSDLPLTEAGELDTEAFTTKVTEAAAEKVTAEGAGSVTGMGGTALSESGDPWAEIDKHLDLPKGA